MFASPRSLQGGKLLPAKVQNLGDRELNGLPRQFGGRGSECVGRPFLLWARHAPLAGAVGEPTAGALTKNDGTYLAPMLLKVRQM